MMMLVYTSCFDWRCCSDGYYVCFQADQGGLVACCLVLVGDLVLTLVEGGRVLGRGGVVDIGLVRSEDVFCVLVCQPFFWCARLVLRESSGAWKVGKLEMLYGRRKVGVPSSRAGVPSPRGCSSFTGYTLWSKSWEHSQKRAPRALLLCSAPVLAEKCTQWG